MYSTHSHANYPYHRCGQANTTSEQGARPKAAFETRATGRQPRARIFPTFG